MSDRKGVDMCRGVEIRSQTKGKEEEKGMKTGREGREEGNEEGKGRKRRREMCKWGDT